MQTTTQIHGTVDPAFAPVRDVFARNWDDHGEVGASLCVYVDGKPVVDIWGGYADEARTREWERDTIVCVWSTTKGITATCAHRLADQGKLDLDAPVATVLAGVSRRRGRARSRCAGCSATRRGCLLSRSRCPRGRRSTGR